MLPMETQHSSQTALPSLQQPTPLSHATVFDTQIAAEQRDRESAAGRGHVAARGFLALYEWLYAAFVTSSLRGPDTDSFVDVARMVLVAGYLASCGLLALVPVFLYLGIVEVSDDSPSARG